MPRSYTVAEGMQNRNRERLKGMLRSLIEEECDKLRAEKLRYERAAKDVKHAAIVGQIRYYDDMLKAFAMLLNRLQPATKHHVPQEDREVDG